MPNHEQPVPAKILRILIAGPGGPCNRPPSMATIKRWCAMGMPYVINPGGSLKRYRPQDCMRWIRQNQNHGGE